MDTKVKTNYQISMSPKPNHDVYFTDEQGYESAKLLLDRQIEFNQLPAPLLKQIK